MWAHNTGLGTDLVRVRPTSARRTWAWATFGSGNVGSRISVPATRFANWVRRKLGRLWQQGAWQQLGLANLGGQHRVGQHRTAISGSGWSATTRPASAPSTRRHIGITHPAPAMLGFFNQGSSNNPVVFTGIGMANRQRLGLHAGNFNNGIANPGSYNTGT